VVHYDFIFSPICSLIGTCGLLETNYVFRVTARVTQLFIPTAVQEKIYEKHRQGGRLKTINPEMFVDFQTGGCIVGRR